ncbi:MAG TPA: hypothetical protein VFN88_14170, partial [Caulobacteraceae bacterium]|nr:hypothetical protein [Caulobacteraceae bacterium]
LFDVGWPDAPHRVLMNSTLAAWDAAGRPPRGARPGEGEVLATAGRGRLIRYASNTPPPDAEGDIEALSLWAGQGVGAVDAVNPAGQIVRDIAAEADGVIGRLAGQR